MGTEQAPNFGFFGTVGKSNCGNRTSAEFLFFWNGWQIQLSKSKAIYAVINTQLPQTSTSCDQCGSKSNLTLARLPPPPSKPPTWRRAAGATPTSAMTSDSDGEHPADSASGPSGCPGYRETFESKVPRLVVQVLHCVYTNPLCERVGQSSEV